MHLSEFSARIVKDDLKETDTYVAGKNAGKKALLALILLVPIQCLATTIFYWWFDSNEAKSIVVICRLWLILFPLLWLKFVEHRNWSWSPPKLGGFRTAVISGLVIAAVIFTAYAVATQLGILHTGKIVESAAKTGLDHPAIFIAGALYWIVFNSLMEEYIWRWFVFSKFEVLLGGKWAVGAAAAAFTAHHVIVLAAQFHWPVVLLGSGGVFLGGVIWSRIYLRYRSVWPCYLSHAIVDTTIFIIGYRLIFSS